ncbi:hypothetical protein AB0F72_21935, partial [Actinoplanes sp. NPDC023936]
MDSRIAPALKDLDAVDWAALEHAYGTADDVPDMIHGLLSADPEERHESRDALISSIAHQGTPYPASAPAVPFLLALLDDPATPDRGELIDLIAFVAPGQPWLPGQLWAPGEPEERRFPVPEPGGVYRATYDAVARGIPIFVALLGDDDAEVAVPAAMALAAFPEHAAVTVPPLALVAAESDAPTAVTTTALLALGATAPRPPPPADPRRTFNRSKTRTTWIR